MTDLSLDLKNSIADLQTRHAALITAVQQYRNGSVGVSKAEIIAAAAALEDRLNTEESTLLGLAGRGVQPSLSLDFMKDMYLAGDVRLKKGYNLTDLVTVRRDTAGSSFNSAGVMVQNAINAPRFDYDPVTKVLKGLLIEEGRTNMATYSDSFDRWSKTQVTVIPNAAVAPDGTLNAAKLVNSTAASWHIINSAGMTVTSGGVYTISVYAKAAEYPRVRICFNNNTVFSGQSVFDLTTGTRVSGTVGVITPAGNGWYKVTFTATALQASSSIAMAMNAVKAGEVDAQTAGDGVSGIYIWGAQCESGAMDTSYIPTPTGFSGRSSAATYLDSAGVLKTVASGVARNNAYGYDPAGVLKPIGLLTEAASTNLCPRSNCFGTGWANYLGGSATITATENAVISPDGTQNATRLEFSSKIAGDAQFRRNIISITSGSVMATSVWLKADKDTTITLRIGNSTVLKDYPVKTTWTRIQPDAGAVDSTAINFDIISAPNAVSSEAKIIDVWGCQVEVNSFATSNITTSGSQVTRAADSVTSSQVARTPDVVTVNTGAWFNAREGTLTAEFSQRTPPITGTFRRVTALVGPNLDEIAIYMSGAAGMINSFVRGIGAVQNDAPAPGAVALAVDEVRRAAVAYKENDLSFSTLGLSATDVTVILPTSVNSLVIGGNSTNLQRWCGHIRSVRYYPKRLTVAQIKILSA